MLKGGHCPPYFGDLATGGERSLARYRAGEAINGLSGEQILAIRIELADCRTRLLACLVFPWF